MPLLSCSRNVLRNDVEKEPVDEVFVVVLRAVVLDPAALFDRADRAGLLPSVSRSIAIMSIPPWLASVGPPEPSGAKTASSAMAATMTIAGARDETLLYTLIIWPRLFGGTSLRPIAAGISPWPAPSLSSKTARSPAQLPTPAASAELK